MTQFCVVHYGVAVTSGYVGRRYLQTVIHGHGCVFRALSSKCALVIASPCEYLAMVGKCDGVHASTGDLENTSGWVQHAHVKHGNLARFLDLKGLIVAETYYEVVRLKIHT